MGDLYNVRCRCGFEQRVAVGCGFDGPVAVVERNGHYESHPCGSAAPTDGTAVNDDLFAKAAGRDLIESDSDLLCPKCRREKLKASFAGLWD